ncbi:MAG: HD-GYP domain-containing protein [Lachnospiraceae bacterium]|nr:HD-GYP domain-containing protein [Lachnospiraceae bacterium]
MKIKKVFTANLKPGMVSSEAVYTSSNHLVIQSNIVLTNEIINKLKQYSVRAIKVYIQEEPNEAGEPFELEGPTYFQRVQESEEFKKFDTEFTGCVDGFKSSLNDFVTKNTDGLVDNMLNDVRDLLGKTRNPLHLLDMLQCMREYDDSTYAHSMNVALVCNVIGNWLHMSMDDLNVLVTCGLLHDIGKLQINPEIITKPGKLTDEEYKQIKNHTLYGYEILKDKNLDERVKLAALQHHERYDGKGYPQKLSGSQIDFFATIVAVADVYDAMTADRCYRKGVCPFSVIEMMEQEKSLYNPGVLYMFMERTIEAYVNTEVLLSNGEKGKVVLLNKSYLSRPVVITEKGTSYDLSKNFKIQIETLV